ncbi:MAG: YihY/virulence factor BrkB family protein [Arcobacter sp.]|uniref:YihY/virulence factor BrkB family protein n=1 Tax=Arcobacter sp. TaxID=1872629 RepID=UPI003B00DD9B
MENQNGKKLFAKVIDALDSFFNDDTTYYAASLSFFTIFSILPIFALIIAIISNLEQFNEYVDLFINYILDLINPSHSQNFAQQIKNFISNSDKLGNIGIVYMLFVFTMFFKDYEYIVNKIHQAKRKSIYASFFFYLFFITLLPLVFAGYIIITTFYNNTIFDFLLTLILGWSIFFVLFKLTVNTYISVKAALLSSFITLIVISITKNLFVYYVLYNQTYTTLYGSMATLLFTFLWIYTSWIIFLYGVKLCHNLNLKELNKVETK